MLDMDPELEAFVPLLPNIDLSDPVADRRAFAAMAGAAPEPDTSGLEIENHLVPGAPGEPEVPVRTYRPNDAQGAVIWMHGGGMVMGDLDTEHRWATRFANASGAVGARCSTACR
jgi:acetyl esterase/lipase